jgi:hypothetical protein
MSNQHTNKVEHLYWKPYLRLCFHNKGILFNVINFIILFIIIDYVVLNKYKATICLKTVIINCEKYATDANYKSKAKYTFEVMFREFHSIILDNWNLKLTQVLTIWAYHICLLVVLSVRNIEGGFCFKFDFEYWDIYWLCVLV